MPKKIRVVVEGGGGKCFGITGALRATEELGVEISAAAGTSAGSIFSSFLAFGYTAAEMDALCNPQSPTAAPWASFQDRGKAPAVAFLLSVGGAAAQAAWAALDGFKVADLSRGVFESGWLDAGAIAATLGAGALAYVGVLAKRLHWNGGLYLGNAVEEWVRIKLREKLGKDRDATFKDARIPLTVVASDLNPANHRTKVVYFSTKNTPGFPVHRAVRASMSIPLAFTTVEEGFEYPGKDDHHSSLVDGGTLQNFPLAAFADGRGSVPHDVFGFLLDEGPPKLSRHDRLFPTIAKLKMISEYARTYSDSVLQNRYVAQVIRLPVGDYGTLNFTPTAEQYQKLTTDAYNAVKGHGGLSEFVGRP